MGETVSVDMGEVKEKPPLPKGVYTFTFKGSKAFLVRSKTAGSDWIGLSAVIVPEGHPDDAFPIWLAVNHAMRDGLDAKKFLKGLGYSVEGAGAVKLGGELATPEQVKAGNGPQAQLSADGKQPIPVGFLKFKGETVMETNKDSGKQNTRLNAVLGRVE
jgi:hypothetical protein